MSVVRKLQRPRGRRRRPRILLCTPEITELPEGMGNAAHYIRAKGGGLGDISAALVRYLHDDGRFELHMVMPKYDTKIQGFAQVSERELDQLAPLLESQGIHLVSDSAFSRLADVYSDSMVHSRVRRAEAFQRYIINMLLDDVRPDVVHCNDWMTGLVPAAARAKGMKTLYTLHNVFTEKETPENIDRSGIDVRRFMSFIYFERFPQNTVTDWRENKVDFCATGVHAADCVNTVSPTFLQEIVTDQLPGIVPDSVADALKTKYANGCAHGILNAPNDTVDPGFPGPHTAFDADTVVEGKRTNKLRFQKGLGLAPEPDAPLFFWPNRLYPQKGPELLLAVALRAVEQWGAQIAVVANGARDLEVAFEKLATRSGGRIVCRRFDETLSALGRAGADFVVMPSRYEPCGLPQMEGMRFGTLPVTRTTGGLRDSVAELALAENSGSGFVFEPYNAASFLKALGRAVEFYRLPIDTRRPHLQRIMRESRERFALPVTAKRYVQLYEMLLDEAAREKSG